jgi:hypothetical protein
MSLPLLPRFLSSQVALYGSIHFVALFLSLLFSRPHFPPICFTHTFFQSAMNRYKLTKLSTTSSADVKSYVAARWHHDRAGRRVKLFVYLHDIDCEEGHPTQVAAGTQALSYYRTEVSGGVSPPASVLWNNKGPACVQS